MRRPLDNVATPKGVATHSLRSPDLNNNSDQKSRTRFQVCIYDTNDRNVIAQNNNPKTPSQTTFKCFLEEKRKKRKQLDYSEDENRFKGQTAPTRHGASARVSVRVRNN
ncbi:hypothetical protein EVAR_61434_1 [Eumeta japonica]|uniref:Uncharacterized protein n=1 Tax=Eumeta variegata TaxID=151549 RepID=A0A4C1Y7H3_EUMVA|nr:hypothetical protein EVAR_61434_1 [Eumeta japonica]